MFIVLRERIFVQLLSYFQLCNPREVCQASLSFTISQSLLKLMSIESLMPSNHLILCHLLLLLPSIFPSIRIFSNESALHIRWPKYKTPLLQLHNIHVFHYRSNEHELGQTPGDGGGRGGLACCSPQGCEESDTTWRMNNNIHTYSLMDWSQTRRYQKAQWRLECHPKPNLCRCED